MKKLTFYFLVSLFFITNVLADQLAVVDIKIGSKLTDYFTTAQISKYNANEMKTDSPFYSYDGKYSSFYAKKESNLYKDDYDFISMHYANKNDEIVSISAVTDFKFNNSDGMNQCIKFRNQKVSEYKKKNILVGFTANTVKKIHPDQVKEDSVWFSDILKRIDIGFVCFDYFESVKVNPEKKYDTDFRIDYLTYDFNEWLQEQFKKLSN